MKYFAEGKGKSKKEVTYDLVTVKDLHVKLSENQRNWKLYQLKKRKEEKESVKKWEKKETDKQGKVLHTAKDEAEKDEASEEDDSSS
ncbi:hypothetical protein Tco_1149187, partial [Tanacetum coccineum]